MTQYPPATKSGFSRKHILALSLTTAAIVAIVYWFVHPAETPLTRAQALIYAGKAAAAIPLLEQFSEQHPDNSAVFPLLAQGYLSCERLGEGRTALDTALKLKLPASTVSPVISAYASYYESKGDFQEAQGLFDSAQTIVPEKDLLEGKAKLYVRWAGSERQTGDLEGASKHLETAMKYTPALAEPLKSAVPKDLTNCYRELAAINETEKKNDKAAISLLQKCLLVADEPATRMALANLYCRIGKIDDAIVCYKRVKDFDQNNLESRHRLIDLYVQKKDYPHAQEALLELTERERSVESYQLLASVDQKMGNPAGAVKALEDARALRPKDLALLQELEQVLIDWGALLSRQGRIQESLSARGHAERVAEMIAIAAKKDEAKDDQDAQSATGSAPGPMPAWDPTVPPIALTSSKIWLAKGSVTPEGEIAIKNVCGQPITDLSLTVIFYDNTKRTRNGSITLPVCTLASPPFAPSATRSLYFSCPNTVKTDDQLAVIIFWHGRLLKELPVAKQR